MKPITILTGSSGLNTNADPAHLSRGQDGRTPLQSCNNIFIGDTGRINRVIGKTVVSTTATHSLYPCGSYGYCVQGGVIYHLQNDSLTAIVSGLGAASVKFERIWDGEKDVTFWMNGTQKGKIIRNTNYAWSEGTYWGPTTTREFSEPVTGTELHYALGRMFIVNGHTIYMSEPANPYIFELSGGRLPYDSGVKMLCGVPQGMWISDSKAIYFIESDGNSFKQRKITDYPALKGRPIRVEAGTLPLQGIMGYGYLAPTEKGLCFLTQTGEIFNLTERSIEFRGSNLRPLPIDAYALAYCRNRAYFSTGSSGWSLIFNLVNMAGTQANLYNSNSCALIRDTLYLASDDGLHKEASSNDFQSEFTFSFDAENLCHMRFIYLYGEFSGNTRVTVMGDQGIYKVYEVRPRYLGNLQHEVKIPVSRLNGISRFWTVKVENLNGSDFSIDRIEVYPFFRAVYRGK